jgi:hypothetical protein
MPERERGNASYATSFGMEAVAEELMQSGTPSIGSIPSTKSRSNLFSLCNRESPGDCLEDIEMRCLKALPIFLATLADLSETRHTGISGNYGL